MSFRLLLAGTLMLAALTSQAIPARKGLFTVTQPDGTELTVRLVGDEHSHRYYSEDGYLLVTENDTFHYGILSNDSGEIKASPMAAQPVAARSSEAKSLLQTVDMSQLEKVLKTQGTFRTRKSAPSYAAAGPGLFEGTSFPSAGEQKALVILVEYSDVKFSTPSPYDYFNRMLNEEGFSDYGGTGSARDFFIENSNGIFKPDFDPYGPVTLKNTRSYYGGNLANGDDRHPEDMAIEACAALDDTVDFSQYDRDGDGLIDNVFVFYAGRGENSGGGASTVWPHSSDIMDYDSTPYMYDGVRLNRYACTNEWNITSATREGRPDGVGTFIHEFSHVLGLPDLYATDSYSTAFTPGAWSTLDYGPYNNHGCTPPLYSAFERYALGWIEPTEISKASDITIKQLTENEAYIIRTDRENEFFLLENRQQDSWDKYLPGHGMLIWHIDYNSRVWDNNSVNNSASHQYVDLEEADNIQSEYSLDGDAFPGTSGKTSFTDDTTPSMKTWASTKLNLPITEIKETNGVISFKVAGGRPAPQKAVAHEATDITPVSFKANWEMSEDADEYLLTVTSVTDNGTDAPAGKYDKLNVGKVTSFVVEGLKAETAYAYTVIALNSAGEGEASDAIAVTTETITFEYDAPVAKEAVVVDGGFLAGWHAMDEADGYILDVYTKYRGTASDENCDFTGGYSSLPEGWSTDSRMTYSMASYSGKAAPSLRLNANYVESPVMSDDIHSVSFWYRGSSAPEENRLVVSACDKDGNWTDVMESGIDNTAGGQTVNITSLPTSTRQIRISHKRPASGAVAIDDICLKWGGEFITEPLEGYTNLNVGNVTQYNVTGIADNTTYYYHVTATKGTLRSLHSNEICVTIGDPAGVNDVENASRQSVSVNGRTVTVIIDGSAVVTVNDIMGRIIRTSQITGSAEFELPTEGIYIISINGKAHKIAVR